MINTNSTVTGRLGERLTTFHIDWLTAALLGFLAIIQTGAFLLYTYLSQLNVVLPEQSGSIELSAGLLAVVVLESLGIVLVWRFYTKLTEFQQRVIKNAIVVGFYLTASYLFLQTNPFEMFIGVNAAALLFYTGYKYLKTGGLYWILFNALALTLGIVVTTLAGLTLSARVIVILLVVAMVWDHYAVRLSGIMDSLISFSTQTGITNYLIIPTTLRFQTDDLKAYLRGDVEEKPQNLAAVIGLGDYILPGMLVVSLYTANQPTLALTSLAGIVVGLLVLRDSFEREQDDLPALLWLNSAAIIGYTSGTILLLAMTGGVGV